MRGDSLERQATYGNACPDRVCHEVSHSFDVSAARGENGGSMPLVPARALRFSKFSTWPENHAAAFRPQGEKPSVDNGLMRFRQRLSGAKGGMVNLTISGGYGEQSPAAGSLPSVTSRTEHRPIATVTRGERRARPITRGQPGWPIQRTTSGENGRYMQQ